MPIHRSTLTTIGVAACCVCSMVTPPAVAQSRFEVLGADSVAAIEGLNVYTIRDNQMASCYTVFVIHPADAPPTSLAVQQPASPPTPAQLERSHVAQTLKDAIATRERKEDGVCAAGGVRTADVPSVLRASCPLIAIRATGFVIDDLHDSDEAVRIFDVDALPERRARRTGLIQLGSSGGAGTKGRRRVGRRLRPVAGWLRTQWHRATGDPPDRSESAVSHPRTRGAGHQPVRPSSGRRDGPCIPPIPALRVSRRP